MQWVSFVKFMRGEKIGFKLIWSLWFDSFIYSELFTGMSKILNGWLNMFSHAYIEQICANASLFPPFRIVPKPFCTQFFYITNVYRLLDVAALIQNDD